MVTSAASSLGISCRNAGWPVNAGMDLHQRGHVRLSAGPPYVSATAAGASCSCNFLFPISEDG